MLTYADAGGPDDVAIQEAVVQLDIAEATVAMHSRSAASKTCQQHVTMPACQQLVKHVSS
jgi:hypothetical protein